MSAPLVSVLVPTYNREDYLADCVRTALAQTCGDLEVVICDNASTDCTVLIARALAAADRRVRVEVNPVNLGPVANFRRCLELARGNYIKFLMSDDRLRPTALERLVATMEADPAIVLATSSRGRFDASGNPLLGLVTAAPVETDTILDGLALGDMALTQNINLIGEPTTVLFRRGAVHPRDAFTFAGRQYRFAADMALWLTLLLGGPAAYLVEPLSDMRVHPAQDQRDPATLTVGTNEWWTLTRDASILGFLADDDDRARAIATFVHNAGAALDIVGMPEGAGLVESLGQAGAALRELQGRLVG